MGLLKIGVPLDWRETKKHATTIQKEGIQQFLMLYQKFKTRKKPTLKWGDEIEYTLVRFDSRERNAQVFLGASELLSQMKEKGATDEEIAWQPEYAEYMIEGVPGIPFGRLLHSFSTVEPNMRKRRLQLKTCLPKGCSALTLSAFPRLGCEDFCYPPAEITPSTGISGSIFFPDAAITRNHPRFQTLTRNIRERRGTKVVINVPVYRDVNTPDPFIEDFRNRDAEAASAALPDHIYMDAMGFGMGCSCLQITFQACCIDEARILYDQLTTMCPIVMALSAATPAIRGYLLDWDCRWGIISASVDDRTEEERGIKPLKNDQFVIPKSRYDSVSLYLSEMSEGYNDVPLVYNKEYYDTLVAGGVDPLLAMHVAHLFIRDPISLFDDDIEPSDDRERVDKFETIQSTNWQSMRFKPPPLNSSIGWRVEFRPTELQLTDFENAAFVAFILLLSRTILKLKLNLLIPLSKVDANMNTAKKRDAVHSEKFYFRHGHLLTTDGSPIELTQACTAFARRRTYSTCVEPAEINEISTDAHSQGTFDCNIPSVSEAKQHSQHIDPEDSYTMMTINEIINGSNTFPGLIPLIRHYVRATGGHEDTLDVIERYLDLIQKRASGELITTAKWIRNRIKSHPDYKHDSYISSSVNFDLMKDCWAVTEGLLHPPELLPSPSTSDSQKTNPPNTPVRPNCRQCCVAGEMPSRNQESLNTSCICRPDNDPALS